MLVCDVCGKECKNKLGLMAHKRSHKNTEEEKPQEVTFNITSTSDTKKISKTPLQVILDSCWSKILEGENRFYLKQPKHATNIENIPATELPLKEALETIKSYMNRGEAKAVIQQQIDQLN